MHAHTHAHTHTYTHTLQHTHTHIHTRTHTPQHTHYNIVNNRCMTHQHIFSWNAHMIQAQETIIGSKIPKLWPNVTHLNTCHKAHQSLICKQLSTWQQSVILKAPQRYKELVYATISPFSEKSGNYNSMSGSVSHCVDK